MTIEERTNRKALNALNKLTRMTETQYQNSIVMEREITLNTLAWSVGRSHIWTDELTKAEQENYEQNN